MTTPFGRLAHNLNNQLTIIPAYWALLLERLPPGEPCREEAEEIRRAAERAGLVARQILDASRRPGPRGGVVDLNQVVTQAAEALRPFIGADVALVAEYRSAGAQVRATRTGSSRPSPSWSSAPGTPCRARGGSPS